MTALILCGGKGRRMGPLREDKWAIEFLGRPLLHDTIDKLRAAGIRNIIFVGNSTNSGTLRHITAELRDVGCSYVMQQEDNAGMAGAVEAAATHLADPFLVVSSNDVVEADAYRLVLEAADTGADVALLAARLDRHFPGGYLVTDERLAVTHIVEKPRPGEEPSDLVNVVVHYHREAACLLDALHRAQTDRDDRYEAAIELLIGEGADVRAVPYQGFWGAIKYPWDLFPIMEHLLGQHEQTYIASTARVSPRAVLEGVVHVGENVRILENAVVRGPAYLGEGSVIGNNVLVRGGVHLGAHSVVGFGTEVKHSYIGRGCWFHTNYIGDSIIDDGCSFGSGAVTANLRFDEASIKATIEDEPVDTGTNKLGVFMGRGCRVGVNASLMPGVLVGPGAIVGSHVCLTADLAEGQKAMPSDAYRVETSDNPVPGPSSPTNDWTGQGGA